MADKVNGKRTEDLKGKTLSLANLIEYQEGAVVSRTVIQKDTGTLTVFAFDSGEGLSEHTAPFDAMVYVMDGTAEVTIEGTLHSVGPGEMIIMPADKPHSLHAAERFKMTLIMIRSNPQ